MHASIYLSIGVEGAGRGATVALRARNHTPRYVCMYVCRSGDGWMVGRELEAVLWRAIGLEVGAVTLTVTLSLPFQSCICVRALRGATVPAPCP